MNNLELRKKILGSIYTNCYFLKNKTTGEMIIVDPADEPDAVFSQVSLMQGKPAAVLLTHGHHDHILAAEAVRDKYHIPIYAGEQEKEMLTDPMINMTAQNGCSCSIEADEWLRDQQELTLAGFVVQVIHTPGHTKGSCCYYFPEEGVLISGDTLFCGSCGRTDFYGGSMSEMKASLGKLMLLPPETEVFPGHDRSTTIAFEKRYNPFV